MKNVGAQPIIHSSLFILHYNFCIWQRRMAMRLCHMLPTRGRAAARKIAIQTDTHLVIIKDGQLRRISAEELRQQTKQ